MLVCDFLSLAFSIERKEKDSNTIIPGKTCLVERYLHGKFKQNVTATVGAAFGAKKVVVGGAPLTLGIWDTAGAERYESMSRLEKETERGRKKERQGIKEPNKTDLPAPTFHLPPSLHTGSITVLLRRLWSAMT